MNVRLASLFAIALLALAAALPQAATAQQLYNDGPIFGEFDGWTINFGFIVSDSFTISGGMSSVTGMSFGAWLSPGDTMNTVQLSITSSENGGTTYFDQVVSVVQSGCGTNQYGFDVCTETANFNGPSLNNGTYWVNLQNAVTTDGDPTYWDANSGMGCTSPGCPSSASTNEVGTIPSESFTILGTSTATTSTTSTTSTTPEPASLILLGSGLLGAMGVLRRKLF